VVRALEPHVAAGRGRCVSIFLDKNRRYIGKSQSKRPAKKDATAAAPPRQQQQLRRAPSAAAPAVVHAPRRLNLQHTGIQRGLTFHHTLKVHPRPCASYAPTRARLRLCKHTAAYIVRSGDCLLVYTHRHHCPRGSRPRRGLHPRCPAAVPPRRHRGPPPSPPAQAARHRPPSHLCTRFDGGREGGREGVSADGAGGVSTQRGQRVFQPSSAAFSSRTPGWGQPASGGAAAAG
jgi:hypothetical protein